eukprot:Blabericola_migrator_1__8523@NODE_444_length_8414_cov_167_650533_g92_i1_p10_GENE_NODE_444_length_8414_cov_167_650533_g92_i1NODE_444_length_8414_cov_167_650533_g92_i1_p10_ORF_typecomplete_len137_score25_47_NODE_444_length_8414_cov_167_650533_g92_i138024212
MNISEGVTFNVDHASRTVTCPAAKTLETHDLIVLWFVIHAQDYVAQAKAAATMKVGTRQFDYLCCLLAEAVESVASILSPVHQKKSIHISEQLAKKHGLSTNTLNMARLGYNDILEEAKSWILKNVPFNRELIKLS